MSTRRKVSFALGDKEVKGLPVTFTVNGAMAASTTVDLEKNGHQEIVMQFVVDGTGDQCCSVSLNDHPITFDDTYDFVLGVRPSLSVIEIGSEPTSCALLFEDDEQFKYTLMEPSRFESTGSSTVPARSGMRMGKCSRMANMLTT